MPSNSKSKKSSLGERNALRREQAIALEKSLKGKRGSIPTGRKVDVVLPFEKYTIFLRPSETRSDEEIISSYESRRENVTKIKGIRL